MLKIIRDGCVLQDQQHWICSLSVSYIEIYNEEIQDLLRVIRPLNSSIHLRAGPDGNVQLTGVNVFISSSYNKSVGSFITRSSMLIRSLQCKSAWKRVP